ncbi:MAG: NAD(P)-dependent glycerol-3-phosphate dehydrogenase [Burkholderiales bacterium]|nr:NAD(P)-dependent glycerol-3-phosphate dehydrogenase [Burkholderiales bacterium]
MQPASAASLPPIAVVGAGSFGTALAIQLARRGNSTRLCGRHADEMADAQRERRNPRYLQDCVFPDGLTATSDLRAALEHGTEIVVATPSHALRETLAALHPLLEARRADVDTRHAGVVVACKGFEPGSGKLSHEVAREVLGEVHPYAVLSGPTFASELGRGLPTAVIVASRDEAFATRVAHRLNGGGFRAYVGRDVIGVELGGASKNVIAIAAGTSDGLGFGANARSLLITRGLAEIRRLGQPMGAQSETLMGLAGLGDLVLTCTDNQSRNRRMGLLLAGGKSVHQATEEIQQVVEGVKAAPEVLRLARRHGVSMPITEVACAVLDGKLSPSEAFAKLASRSVRAE